MSDTRTTTATAVMTRPSRVVQPSRAYDHLYDSVYHVSGESVHNRHLAQAAGNRTVVVPHARNMFSELVHHPRGHVEVRSDDPVPTGVPRDFAARMGDTMTRQRTDFARARVTGGDRYKYAGLPEQVAAVAAANAPGGVVLAADTDTLDAVAATARAGAHTHVPATRTIGTQSDYRESETQTDPWTPEYVVRPGSAPEVLTLASLSYGHGLPAGLNEVIMIERARAKRAWEKTLPDVADEKQAAQRIKMMEEQDAMEWRWREEEIEQIQAQRIRLVEQLVADRERDDVTRINARLEVVMAERRAQREHDEITIQAQGLRELRKLQRKRRNVEPQKEDSSAVAGYTNPASRVYARTQRHGDAPRDDMTMRYDVQSPLKDTYHGLLELEASLPPSMTNPRVVRPPKRRHAVGAAEKSEDRYQVKLESILARMKIPSRRSDPPLRLLERVPTPPVRPPAGVVEGPTPAEEAREQAVLLLQRLVRGRAEQSRMCDGRDRRKELIEEMRTTHALEQAEQEIKAQEKADVQRAQHEANVERAVRDTAESAVQESVGQHGGRMLDFLSKELVRLQEERRIHAFAMLADRQRRMREAAEAGRREREQLRRQQNDEIFRQIVGVHQESVDTFLEDILLDAQSVTADAIAREEIQTKAAEIDRVAQELFVSGVDQTEEGAMSISAELVSQFLLPEAEKAALRDDVKQKQRRLQMGAHKELLGGVSVMEQTLATARPSSRASSARRSSRASSARPRDVVVQSTVAEVPSNTETTTASAFAVDAQPASDASPEAVAEAQAPVHTPSENSAGESAQTATDAPAESATDAVDVDAPAESATDTVDVDAPAESATDAVDVDAPVDAVAEASSESAA